MGTKAVEKYSKLVVLGKPGAGKTTFLKYLIIRCNLGDFQADKVPIFITLKDFAETDQLSGKIGTKNSKEYPSLLDYILLQFAKHNVTPDQVENILTQGRGLILLDGLDEVREEDSSRIIKQIKDFSEKFNTNWFVITCRIGAKEYVFEHFTEVEVADFDINQICTFAKKWFQIKDVIKVDKFIQKVKENEPIQELATSPLLLTLLCLVFGEKADFPSNRSELYKEGLDILLKKWDAKRNIERDKIYEQLSLQRKEDLLSQIARLTFERGDYFFKQKELEQYIADYIQNLPEAKLDPEALRLDSEAILKSIEAQHGLLTERARGIYSFSHLTFHEYFTAREIVLGLEPLEKALKDLSSHFIEPRWREVFLLTVGMLRNADYLLSLMKRNIDSLIENDEDLQNFLNWISQKSHKIGSFYKPSAVRAFYLAFDLARALSLERVTNQIIDFAKQLATDLIFEETITISLENIRELIVELDFDFGSTINPDRTLAFAIDNDLTINRNGELVLQEFNEINDLDTLTSIEAVEDELSLLQEINLSISEIEAENTGYMADIEELEAKRAIIKKQVKDIEKEQLKAEENEIDEIKDTLEEINDELEEINEEIDSYKEGIEELMGQLQFSLDEANIDIEQVEDEIIFEKIHSELGLKIQTLEQRLSELRKQESQQEFDSNLSLNSLLSNLLLEVKAQLPDPGIFGISFENWWLENGTDWAEKLRNRVCKLIIDFRNLGYDWQFNNQQMKLLNQYYDGNKLLVDCLNSDCYMSRLIREKIEGTLLLPIAEIEQSPSYKKV
ncbi:NACHT domain-containing protein [Nostoc sp. DedQUE07]|uniref:NACHT domain-containing protein n=1 Tax=Nostoc sp. DedQUE07 TaxID=3075392 RepID=UPI002AD3F949|nr:NACHT domain-containing protein [Nostoc sp. DedQUE07]MDZ8127256.1 NACHT domain-containing protein [Nostoc sp. DedQUE07]